MRRILLQITCLTLLVIISSNLYGQTGALRVSIQGPEAASLGQYGDTPVGLYNGTANIQIPIHEAKSRKLSIPINLQYNASGIKVEAIPSWVGSGWTLNATGVITRSVRGIPDEDIYGYYNQGDELYVNNNWSNPSFNFLQDISLGNIDSEPDKFYFNFGGRTGQFILGPKDEYGQGVAAIRTIPNEKIIIEPVFSGGDNLYKWIIITEDGTKYTFEKTELVTEQVMVLTGADPEDDNEYFSSWFLSKIESAEGDDKIELNYSGYTASHELKMFEEDFTFGGSCKPSDKKIQTIHQIASQRLISISTPSENILFDASLRSDDEYRLDSIRIQTKSGELKKKFNLNYLSRTDRLFLGTIEQIPIDGGMSDPITHTFSYNTTLLPERLSNSIDHWGFYNGKSNGSYTLPELTMSSARWGNIHLNGADRSPSSNHMNAGILTKITYPTGGSTEFTYEPNDYASVSGQEPQEKIKYSYDDDLLTEYNVYGTSENSKQVIIGGEQPVNVKVLVNFEPDNDCGGIGDCYVYFAGNYFNNSNQSGFPATYDIVLNPGTYYLKAVSPEYQNAFAYIKIDWEETFSVNSIPEIPGIMAGGLRVSEIKNIDGLGNESIKKYEYRRFSEDKADQTSGVILSEPRYHYDTAGQSCEFISRSTFTRLPLGLSHNNVGYTEVTVLNDWDAVSEIAEGGKSVSFFRTAEITPESSYNQSEWPFSPKSSREWERGQLIRTEEYNNSNDLLFSTDYSYAFEKTDPNTTRDYLALSYKVVYDSQDPYYIYSPYLGIYSSYIFESGWRYLQSKTTTVHTASSQDIVSTTEVYTYGNTSHLQLTEKLEANSDGKERITEITYAHEIDNDGTGKDYTGMFALNMISQPYSVTIKDDTENVISKRWTRWDNPAGFWRPKEEWIWYKGTVGVNPTTSTSFKDVTWNNYDTWGNPLQYIDANNNVVNLEYDIAGVFLAKIEQVKPGGGNLNVLAQYNTKGQLSELINEFNVESKFNYDDFGRLETVSNTFDELIQDYLYELEYSGGTYAESNSNYIQTRSYTDSQTRTARQYMDGLGRLIQSQAYDGSHSIISALEYDNLGREWKSWKPYSLSGSISYDSTFSSASAGFREQLYEPSPLNRPDQMIPEGGLSFSGSVDLDYDVREWGTTGLYYLVTTTTDEDNKVTETWSDGWGRTAYTISDPGGLNIQTAFIYDELDRLEEVRHPNYANPPAGSSPSDWVTTYDYDSRGLLTQRVSKDSGTSLYSYDAAGNLRFSQDANQAGSNVASYTGYDFAGRPTVEGVADIGATTFANLDADTMQTFEDVDANKRGVYAYEGKPSTSTYPWSEFGTLIDNTTLSNTTGNLTGRAWRFGGGGVAETAGLNGIGVTGDETYLAATTITAENTVVSSGASLTLKAGQTITLKPGFHAEAGSQLLGAIDGTLALQGSAGISSAAGSNPWQVELFSYDSEGRVKDKWIWTGNRREWDTHLAYDYNRLGEVTRMKVQVGTQTLYQHYDYNLLGQLTHVYLTEDGNLPSQPVAEVSYTYNPSGAIDEITYRGNTPISHGYDIRDRLTDINDMASTSGSPFAAQYNYEKNSRINWASFWNPNVDTNLDLNSDHFKYTYNYTYDNPGRLTSAVYQPDGPSTNEFNLAGITYDANGNIRTMDRYGAAGSLIDDMTYSYGNGNNQLSSISDAAGLVHGWDGASGSFSYDANGNLTAMTGNPSISNIAYDHRNLSVHTWLAGNVEQIANYNAEGQRIIKEVQGPSGTTWSFYVRDGMSTLAVVANGDLQFMNIHGNGIAGRVEANGGAISTSGARRYYIADLLGSVRAVVDDAGVEIENRDYDPWGVPMDQRQFVMGSEKALEQFSGKELDNETGWYHFGQRDLMAVYGRWPSPDRFADQYPSHSPYHYALNDPVRFMDVNGDTVTIDPELLRPVVYHEGHERAGEQKDISDMSSSEKQAYFFQQYLYNGGAEELAAFHIGGEFETTNITFSFATESPGQTFLGITLPFTNKNVGFGLTTFGLRNEPLHLHDTGESASVVRTSLDNIDFNIYLSPVNVRDTEYTARHEMGHVRYITGRFLQGIGTPILSGTAQDGKERGVSKPYIPTIYELIKMKNK